MTNTDRTLTALETASPEHIAFCTKRYAKRHGMKASDVRRIPALAQCALYEVDELGSLWHPGADGVPARQD